MSTSDLDLTERFRLAAHAVGKMNQREIDFLVMVALEQHQARLERGAPSLDPALVTVAAVLMKAQDLSAVTALMHAEEIETLPQVGEGLIKIQAGLENIRENLEAVQRHPLLRRSLVHVLGHVRDTAQAMLAKMPLD